MQSTLRVRLVLHVSRRHSTSLVSFTSRTSMRPPLLPLTSTPRRRSVRRRFGKRSLTPRLCALAPSLALRTTYLTTSRVRCPVPIFGYALTMSYIDWPIWWKLNHAQTKIRPAHVRKANHNNVHSIKLTWLDRSWTSLKRSRTYLPRRLCLELSRFRAPVHSPTNTFCPLCSPSPTALPPARQLSQSRLLSSFLSLRRTYGGLHSAPTRLSVGISTTSRLQETGLHLASTQLKSSLSPSLTSAGTVPRSCPSFRAAWEFI
jgi:hypothetical protein